MNFQYKIRTHIFTHIRTIALGVVLCSIVLLLTSCGFLIPNKANLTLKNSMDSTTLSSGIRVKYAEMTASVNDQTAKVNVGSNRLFELEWYDAIRKDFDIEYSFDYTVTSTAGVASTTRITKNYKITGIGIDDFISVDFHEPNQDSNDPTDIRVSTSIENWDR